MVEEKSFMEKASDLIDKMTIEAYLLKHTCARCGKPFERTPLGEKSISISVSTKDEYILLNVCPKCYLKWKIEFDIEVF